MKAASAEDVHEAAEAAAAAFYPFSRSLPAVRARFLRAIADGLERLGDILVECAARETALGSARILNERSRTCMQLRLFADIAETNQWIDERVDMADPARKPQAKPRIARGSCHWDRSSSSERATSRWPSRWRAATRHPHWRSVVPSL